MKKTLMLGAAAALLATTSFVVAQEGIGRADADGNYRPLQDNLKVFGGFDFAESCSYDPSRDLIVVPKDRHHRFFLTDQRSIRCVRLFQDPAGWTPVYREAS